MDKLSLALLLSALWIMPAAADSTQARCDIYAKGEDHADMIIPCTFSQSQGHVTITREDGVTHDLTPVVDALGNFRDQNGAAVYRQSGLGDQGLIFRFPEESIFLYWSTAGLDPSESDNPTAPFSTKDYDATTLLRCGSAETPRSETCPAGILRMENKQASIVVQSPVGEQFTINFMSDYVNATNREAKATLEGDTWTVTVDGTEVYEVPLAAIEGG